MWLHCDNIKRNTIDVWMYMSNINQWPVVSKLTNPSKGGASFDWELLYFYQLCVQCVIIDIESYNNIFCIKPQGLEINIQVSVSILISQRFVCTLDPSLGKYKIRGPVNKPSVLMPCVFMMYICHYHKIKFVIVLIYVRFN